MAVTNLTNEKSLDPTDAANQRSLVVEPGMASFAGPVVGCVKLRQRKENDLRWRLHVF